MGTGTTAFGRFGLDRDRQRLTRDGVPVSIGHRGYLLLETLLDAGGQPVGKDALIGRAWPNTIVEEGNLSVQISALRRQLGEGSGAMIVNVPRVGYRLVVTAGPPTHAGLPDRGHGFPQPRAGPPGHLFR
jgi:DNA-binding winged helix-turn-helix (wHTH) protein